MKNSFSGSIKMRETIGISPIRNTLSAPHASGVSLGTMGIGRGIESVFEVL